MRVIAGFLKGRKLHPPKGLKIRPSSDYLRESIFNILSDSVKGATVLDLFAGTGSLGIEALSRGAESAVFVDMSPQAVKIIVRNISDCDLDKKSIIFKRDILRGLKFLSGTKKTFDLVFMDPPYDKGLIERTLDLLGQCDCVAPVARIVAEHSLGEVLSPDIACFERADERQHGKTLVSFYEYVMKQPTIPDLEEVINR